MRRKLLLADDSITVQRVIELTFSDEGLDIVTVGDGAQAIERLQQDRPDIVLADLNMPGADGYAVAEHVKRGSDLVDHTRVVLLTGAFEPVDQDRARGLGVDGVLAKPFEPQVAIELVRQLLEQAPLSPPRAEAPVSDWTAGTETARAATGSAWGEQAEGEGADATPVAAVAAGYPFEPGTATARSTPAELDDYFQRLDEALTNAGLTASPAVRSMLAETKGPEGGARATERAASVGSTVEEEKSQMSATPPTGATNVTLVDAFSALLAAEQVSGPAGTNLEFWAPPTSTAQPPPAAPAVSAESERVEVVIENARPSEEASVVAFDSGTVEASTVEASTAEASTAEAGTVEASSVEVSTLEASAVEANAAEAGAAEASTAEAGAVKAASIVAAPHAGGPAEVLPVSESEAQAAAAAAAASAAPASEAQIEAIVRRVFEEMTERLVREIAQTKVIDVAERLVREEIDRLKAAASDDAS